MRKTGMPGIPILFHEFVDCLAQIVDGILISGSYGIHHTVPHMVFQNDFSGVVQSGTDSGKLNQNFRAVGTFFHHAFDFFQMADGPGQPVDDRFLVLMNVTVAMGNAMVMQCGVIVWMHGV